MKGIILSGGLGSRLYPITKSLSKQILPIYDKPMIYYSLSVLMLSGINEILLISTKEHIDLFKKQLGNGKHIGISITYKVQKKPSGIPEAFKIGEKFIGNNSVFLILGDNFFYGQDLSQLLKKNTNKQNGCKIFIHHVNNPEDYGVIKLNSQNNISDIVEKPKKFISNLAITGMYIFDKDVVKKTKKLKFSNRGELEITDLIKMYKKNNSLEYDILGRGYTWFDAGNFDNLLSASLFVKAIEERQGFKIGCIEEIAYNNKWINKKQFLKIIEGTKESQYSQYLKKIVR